MENEHNAMLKNGGGLPSRSDGKPDARPLGPARGCTKLTVMLYVGLMFTC